MVEYLYLFFWPFTHKFNVNYTLLHKHYKWMLFCSTAYLRHMQ